MAVTAYHEAGHAVAAVVLGLGSCIEGLTLRERSDSYGHITMKHWFPEGVLRGRAYRRLCLSLAIVDAAGACAELDMRLDCGAGVADVPAVSDGSSKDCEDLEQHLAAFLGSYPSHRSAFDSAVSLDLDILMVSQSMLQFKRNTNEFLAEPRAARRFRRLVFSVHRIARTLIWEHWRHVATVAEVLLLEKRLTGAELLDICL